MEFAVAAWAPWLQADIDCLEAVQKRAVKAISGLRASTYEERLRELACPAPGQETRDRHGPDLQASNQYGYG